MKAKFKVNVLNVIGDYEEKNYNNHAFDGIFDNYDCIAMIVNNNVIYIPKKDLGIKDINELKNISTEDIIKLSINIGQEIKEAMKELSNCFKNNNSNIICNYKGLNDYEITSGD